MIINRFVIVLISIVIPTIIVSILLRNKKRNKKDIVHGNIICYTNGIKNIFRI